MATTGTSNADSQPLPSRDENACTKNVALHIRGIAVALCFPLAVFMYKFNPDVHDSIIDVISQAMMWGGILLIGPYFVVPCFNARRFGLLWYSVTIPMVLLMWILDVVGIRG